LELAQLEPQQFVGPACPQGRLIVGDHIRAPLRLGQVR
jgi:hypothetical protein